ncbi:DUF3034 family protein [Erythrobacter cryptus]|uniref:DUF3034 family protein n=1 Tax=Erythrobacter cryptus TaxID=196588 RepID=UPI0003F6B1B2|nr:DUF3034 family protein [Erythrobacter cryptus]
MSIIAPCLATLCSLLGDAASADPQIAYEPVIDAAPVAPPVAPPAPPAPPAPAAMERALAPLAGASALGDAGLRLGRAELFKGGKLLLTNGVATAEGSSGGGLARWATIGGRQMPGGIGASLHATAIELADYGWRSYGVLVGVGDRLELSYARADFDTRKVGVLLGIGEGYAFNLDTFGAKLRLAGDLVYGAAAMPQIAIGIEHKRSRDGALVRALGAAAASGTDVTLSATKLLLGHSLLANATLRYTKANELGLLGFGAAGAGHELHLEGSLAYQLSRRAVVGTEYRSKPDNLGLSEDDWIDLFAAYALTRHLTVTAAYVDLGAIATIPGQRGGFLSAQVAF